VHWSVFGEFLPSLNTQDEIDRLRSEGFAIDRFASRYRYKSTQDILEPGVISMLDALDQYAGLSQVILGSVEKAVSDTSNLLLEILLNKQDGLDFFRFLPKDEIASFSRNVLLSRLSGEPLSLVSSTCPDYIPRTYQLRGGVGLFAERTLVAASKLRDLFEKYNVSFRLEMHLADGDVADPSSLEATGESRASFIEKIDSSVLAIRHRIRELGMQTYVSVLPMSNLFEGIASYAQAHHNQKESIAKLYAQSNRKVASAVKSLTQERKQLGDFDAIEHADLQFKLVIAELAGYSAYGHKIAGSSLIVSPGAKSVVPAYNFGLQGSRVSPVVYVQNNLNRKNSSIFDD